MVSSNQEEVIASAILHSNTSKIQLRAGAAANCSNRDCTFSAVYIYNRRHIYYLRSQHLTDCSAVPFGGVTAPLNEHLLQLSFDSFLR